MLLETEKITSTQQLEEFTKEFWSSHQKPYAFGIGIIHKDNKDSSLVYEWLINAVDTDSAIIAAVMNVLDLTCTNQIVLTAISKEAMGEIYSFYLNQICITEKEERILTKRNLESFFDFWTQQNNKTNFVLILVPNKKMLHTIPTGDTALAEIYLRMSLFADKLVTEDEIRITDEILYCLPVLAFCHNNVVETLQEYNKRKLGITYIPPRPPLWAIDNIPPYLWYKKIPSDCKSFDINKKLI